MAWWVLLLIQVGLQIVSGLLANKPNAKAEKSVDMPQNDGSTPIPVIFGECLVKGATVIDYFDFKAVPIKIRNPATFFLTKITVGYKYYLGMVFGIGWGKTPQTNSGVTLHEIFIDNRSIWTGTAEFNDVTPVYINRPSFFGAEKQEGGINVKIIFYNGEDTGAGVAPQTPNTYWEAQRGLVMPEYQDLCYAVWQGPSQGNLPLIYGGALSGYIGNAARLWPISFRVVRQPSCFGGGTADNPGDTPGSIGNHANPIDCLYEVLTSTDFGAGIPAAQINTSNFSDAELDCWSEGLGFSYLWTSASPVEEMVAEILRFVDAAIYTDLQTGKIEIKLVRAETPSLTLTNDDFIEIESFTRGAWEDTKNEVRVTFPDHTKVDFENSTAYWHELANRQIQGATDAVEITYQGCVSSAQANRLAARDGRVYATPLAKLSGRLDRKAWTLVPGSTFYFTWTEQGITNMAMRVANVKLGTLIDGSISINAVEDIFAAGEATYGSPATTIWTDPLAADAEDSTYGGAGEIPYWMQRDDSPRVFGVSSRPDDAHISYDGSLNTNVDVLNADFTPTGTLDAALDQLSGTDYDTTGFLVEAVTEADRIVAGTSATIATEGAALALIGDPSSNSQEWIAFESITDNEDGTVTLDNVWRGLMDTPPRDHAAGTRVWFFADGNSMFVRPLGNAESITFEALNRTMRDQLTTDEATNRAYTTQRRAYRPLPPYYVLLGGSYTNEEQSTGDVVLTWREHSRLTQLQVMKQSATTETAESGVTYEIDIYNDSGGTPSLLRAVTALATPTYTYTNADELADLGAAALADRLRFDIYSMRDSVRSLYVWYRYVYRVSPGSFGNSNWILPAQVFNDPQVSSAESGWDELGVQVFDDERH